MIPDSPVPNACRTGPTRPKAASCWAAAFLAAAALYLATGDRGPEWQDSGWQQWRILTGSLDHPVGLALVHPLQYWLGRFVLCIPLGEPLARITALSSLAGAIAIANLAATCLLVTGRIGPTFVAATAMMFAHTFWQHSTHTESYALVGALLTAEWLCLAMQRESRRPQLWLIGMAAANGLGIANHMLAALDTPIVAAVLFAQWRRGRLTSRGLCVSAFVWTAGTLPYAALVLRAGLASADWGTTLYSAFFGDFRKQVLNVDLSFRLFGTALGFVIYNFPNLILPLAIGGALSRPREAHTDFARVLLAYLAVHGVFELRYPIVDQYSFLFPVYFCLAALAAIGAARIDTERRATRALLLAAGATSCLSPAVYWASYRLLGQEAWLNRLIVAKPYRDGPRAMLLPWTSHDYAARTNQAAFALARHEGIIVYGESTMEHALLYHGRYREPEKHVRLIRLDDVRRDQGWAAMRLELQAALAEGRAVVHIPRDREAPDIGLPDANFERRGDLYRLVGFRDTTPDAR
ncbi:MAG: DUF2723 domain-containing protein [Planctomycetes bacterium]|nr:DUF2723 domain-containing protein [Planctomycetota bacterium]